MKNETMDGLVSYEMGLSQVNFSDEKDYLLNGSVHGFGHSHSARKTGDLGAYDFQRWVIDILPGKIADGLTFDSESCEFYVYSDNMDKLEFIVNLMDRVILEYNRLEVHKRKGIETLFNPLHMYNTPLTNDTKGVIL